MRNIGKSLIKKASENGEQLIGAVNGTNQPVLIGKTVFEENRNIQPWHSRSIKISIKIR